MGHGDDADGAGNILDHVQGVAVVAVVRQGVGQLGQILDGLGLLGDAHFRRDVLAVVDAAAGLGAGAVDAVDTAVHGDVVVDVLAALGKVGIISDVVGDVPEGAGAGGVHHDRITGAGEHHQHGHVGGISQGQAGHIAVGGVGHPLDVQPHTGGRLDGVQHGVAFHLEVNVGVEVGHHHGDDEGFLRHGEAHHGEEHRGAQEQSNQFPHSTDTSLHICYLPAAYRHAADNRW